MSSNPALTGNIPVLQISSSHTSPLSYDGDWKFSRVQIHWPWFIYQPRGGTSGVCVYIYVDCHIYVYNICLLIQINDLPDYLHISISPACNCSFFFLSSRPYLRGLFLSKSRLKGLQCQLNPLLVQDCKYSVFVRIKYPSLKR